MAGESLFGTVPDSWELTTLGEACRRGGGSVQTGPFGSQLHAADYVPQGTPSIMPQNIGDNRVIEDGIARITADDAERLSRYLVRPGDIVYSRRGDVEKRALIRDSENGWLCGTGCLRVRFGKNGEDPSYASYYLGHQEVRAWIVRHAQGATMPNLNTSILSSLPFVAPPLAEQRAIAHILGTLDDKIELNRRVNETLEEMARAIFKSWFVDFDPVRAKVEGRDPGLPEHIADLFPDCFEDSELGEIPAGWEVGAIESLCESIASGGTPARMNPMFWDGGTIPWFKTGELLDGSLLDSKEHITEAALAGSACKLWPTGTILFALYASPTVGRLGVLTRPGTSNQAAAGLVAKPAYAVPFLRRLLLQAREKLQSIAVGAAQQNINQGVLKSHRVVVPDTKIVAAFCKLVAASDERQVSLAEQSRALSVVRDTLLPRLISGELRVGEAERMVEEGS